MTRKDIDRAIAGLASRQHNVFSDRQAAAAGASASLRKRRRAAGDWIVETPGVYRLPGAVQTWQRRLMIAHLDLGLSSLISHRAAAALQTFPGAGRGAPELTIPRGASRGDRWRVHEGDVPATDRTQIEGIPVTTVARTVLDLATVLPKPAVRRTFESLVIAKRLDVDSFRKRVDANRRPGRPGSVMLADILYELVDGPVPPASELEAKLFALLKSAGLPDPVRQHPLPSITREGWVDAAYLAARLIIEVDGRLWHSRLADLDRDHHRDIEAGLFGWRVLRFTWADLVERPEWVCYVVAEYLRQAA